MRTQLQREREEMDLDTRPAAAAAARSKISRRACFLFLVSIAVNSKPLPPQGEHVCDTQNCKIVTFDWLRRRAVWQICTAGLKSDVYDTAPRDPLARCSVNTDDLFHTFSGLFATLLLPSRQMSLNRHYLHDRRGPNNEGGQDFKRKAHNVTEKATKIGRETEIVLLLGVPHCSDSLLLPVKVELRVIWSSIVFLQGAIKLIVPCFPCQEW